MKLNKLKLTLKSVFSALIVSILLSSCATKQVQVKSKPEIIEEKPIEQTQFEPQKAIDFINLAKDLPEEQSLKSLIQASELLIIEEDFQKAQWLANKTEPLIQLLSVEDAEKSHLSYRIMIVKAQSHFHLQQFAKAFAQLNTIDEFSEREEIINTQEHYEIAKNIYSNYGRTVDAINAQLHAFSLNQEANQDDVLAIWTNLNEMADWQLQQLVTMKPPFIDGWARLSSYARRFGANQLQFKRYVTQWRNQFPVHPAFIITETFEDNTLGEQSNEITEFNDLNNIAVLLPLSGPQVKAGIAAQQGILAAFQQDETKKLHFIDSATSDWSTLQSTLTELKVNHVIGPLLRSNVNKYLAVENLTIPTLLLNLPNSKALLPHQYALSMRPEDEAMQAASSLARLQFKQPIVLSHDDAVSKRIALAFTKQWQLETQQTLETVYFEQGKKMQTNLKESLDVAQSQARIKEIDLRVKYNVKSEARNRRDVDMIYIVGTPTQTRLVKPYIDVNIAPFADLIPVYASSRSHSVKIDTSNTRDLEGLTFTEMPWLLESKQQNKQLAQLTQNLFPQRSDSLQRIFAMGYDSLTLVEKLEVMQSKPYVRHYGQTGVLQLNSDNTLTRSLLWGKYQKDKVNQIAME